MLCNDSASRPLLRCQKTSWKASQELLLAQDQTPRAHPAKLLSQPMALRPCTRRRLALFHIMCLTQSPRDDVAAFPTVLSLLTLLPAQPLHSQSPAPFVTPSPPYSAACKTSCLLQAPQGPGRGAAARRPGCFPAACERSSAPTHTHGYQVAQFSRCFQMRITCLLHPTAGGPAGAKHDNKDIKNKGRKINFKKFKIVMCNIVKALSK